MAKQQAAKSVKQKSDVPVTSNPARGGDTLLPDSQITPGPPVVVRPVRDL